MSGYDCCLVFLGRLLVTTVDGLNADGTKYDQLYTYGGRSFSIRRADDMTLVYDSGDELATKTQATRQDLFNADGEEEFTVAQTFDHRSDDKVGNVVSFMSSGFFLMCYMILCFVWFKLFTIGYF